MAIIYGYRFGVSGQANIGEWRIQTHNAVPIELATSKTGSAAITIPGSVDWEGRCTGFGYAPTVNPGATFTFAGMLDKPGTEGVGVSGSAIVTSVTVSVAYDRNDPVQWMMEFAGNGQLTYGQVTVSDSGIPEFTPACTANVLINGATPSDLTSIILTAQNNAVRYNVASSPCGVYRRVAGANTAACRMEYYHSGTPPHALGSKVRVQIGAWDVNPLIVINAEDYGVRGRDDRPPSVVYTCGFGGYIDSSTKGTITTPNGAVW